VLLLLALALSPLTIDYPAEGALFPPGFAPPTILWRDTTAAKTWTIQITFSNGAAPIRLASNGPRPKLGEIDPDCVSSSNQPPTVDTRQHAWKPGPATWAQIQRHSTAAPAIVTITGVVEARLVSKAEVRLRTSTDPVGAPIFYRDVPLMPAQTATGAIQPLAPYAVRLVKWRLRDTSQPQSHVVMQDLPVCANCHSFSRDGQAMGMDLDGLQNNKGQYFRAKLQPDVNVTAADVIQWSTAQGRLKSPIRVGFMSQISPNGDAVATTIDTPGSTSSNYYVANFADYRFLQVFFPTRGLLAWFRPDTGILQPLPGADDPAYVQFGAVWSPGGDSLVFARAKAQDPNPPGRPPAKFSNDPNELQIQYDLYSIPFNNGRGGQATPIAGASQNGMSNTFPKLSPDGRWLVYVQARNGQLMRPDSRLYIVPATGGQARRMNCNTPRMNSWHSFSPNGRWLVFSSKARSPYTQMYLTHIDENGNDTPPILIENSTAANRAVNLPEFVNVPPGGLQSIGGPAFDYYRLYDRALYLEKEKRFEESAAQWKALLDIAPGDPAAQRHRDLTLLLASRRTDAALAHWRESLRLNPNDAAALRGAAWILATHPALHHPAESLALATRALALAGPNDAAALDTLAAAYAENGRFDEAIATARRAIAAAPARAPIIKRRIQRYQSAMPWRE